MGGGVGWDKGDGEGSGVGVANGEGRGEGVGDGRGVASDGGDGLASGAAEGEATRDGTPVGAGDAFASETGEEAGAAGGATSEVTAFNTPCTKPPEFVDAAGAGDGACAMAPGARNARGATRDKNRRELEILGRFWSRTEGTVLRAGENLKIVPRSRFRVKGVIHKPACANFSRSYLPTFPRFRGRLQRASDLLEA